MEVQIANPIYDVVFKYMMEDNAVAKLLISSIIGEEVVSLEPKPQEHTRDKVTIGDSESSLTVYRLDFSAKIKVPNGQKDVATSKIIKEKSDFIESLHHKTWIIQISCLKDRRRNELEQLLSVFDQSNITADWHILNVKEENFPEKFRPIIRRLKSAASNPKVKRQMKAEDEFIRYLRDWLHVEKNKALEKSKKTIEEKDKALAEKNKSLAEKDKEIEALKRQLKKQ